MTRRQSLDAASTLSTVRGLPAYTSRVPSVTGADVRRSSSSPFSDRISIVPSCSTNGSSIIDNWDLQTTPTLGPQPNVHEYSVGCGLQSSVDQPWLKWLVFSPSSPGQVIKPSCPRYFGGSNVACRVVLSPSGPKNVTSIAVVLQGMLYRSFGPFDQLIDNQRLKETYIFLNDRSTTDTAGLQGLLPLGSAKGTSWFWMEASSSQGVAFAAPQTIQDEIVTVEYHLTLIVNHGPRRLKRSTQIQTRVVFIPNIISDSLSIPRQIAYKDGLWKPGSKDDIRWTSTPPLILRGVFEGEEQVVRYTVSLANPLSYTQGTFIPVHLEIACSNLRLLGALHRGECHDIRLVCKKVTLIWPKGEMYKCLTPGIVAELMRGSEPSILRGPTMPLLPCTQVKVVSNAFFSDDTPIHYQHLDRPWPDIARKGEIHLSSSLLPSSSYVSFSVHYEVQINTPTGINRSFVPLPIRAASIPVSVTQSAPYIDEPVKMTWGSQTARRQVGRSREFHTKQY